MIKAYLARGQCKRKVMIAVASLIIAGLLLITTSRYGAGLSPDSTNYVAAARNFLQGQGLRDIYGAKITVWSPLYPVTLAGLACVTGLDPLDVAAFLNALLSMFIVVLVGTMMMARIRSDGVFAAVLLTVALSPVLMYVGSMAWTETLFIALSLGAIVSMEAYIETPTLARLVILALVLALVPLTRYIGVVLIGVWVIRVVLARGWSLRDRLVRGALVAAIAGMPLAIWMARNYLISGSLMGSRPTSSHSFIQNIDHVVGILLAWLIENESLAYNHHVQRGAFAFAVIVLVWIPKQVWSRLITNQFVRVVSLYVLMYCVMLVISSTTTAYDQIDNRLLSPVFVPILVLMALFVDEWLRTKPRVVWQRMVTVCAVLWLTLVPMRQTAVRVNNGVQSGAGGYNTAYWRDNQLLASLPDFVEKGPPAYSNAPDVLYVLAGVQAQLTPQWGYHNSPDLVEGTLLDHHVAKEEDAYIVWFTRIGRPYLYSLQDLQRALNTEILFDNDEGTVLHIRGASR